MSKNNNKKIKYLREYLGITITAQTYGEIREKHKVVNSASPGFLAFRDEINLHTKHLRAYLRGVETFTHGYNRDKEGRAISPRVHTVQAKLEKIEPKKDLENT